MITTSHEAEFTQNSFIKEQGKKEKAMMLTCIGSCQRRLSELPSMLLFVCIYFITYNKNI